jgi:hypothetical protein|tara:strand:- start:217 stop:507 length:291 start_codon:yes stop_codon:yes gene_type:complete
VKKFKEFREEEEQYEAESREMQNDLMDHLDKVFLKYSLTESRRIHLIVKFILECYAPAHLTSEETERLRDDVADDIENGERIKTYSEEGDETGTYH